MHIAIEASQAASKQKTGVEHYARQIIGHLVRFIVLARNNPLFDEVTRQQAADMQLTLYCREQPDEWLQQLDTYEFVTVKQLKWPVDRLWTQGRMSLEMLTCQPDLLFVPASALPFVTARATVTTVHDVGFMAYPQAFTPRERSFLAWSTRRALAKSARVITVSEFSKGEIIRYFGAQHEEKITVIPLGVDSERFGAVDHETARSRLRTTCQLDRPFILFVGRRETKKNIVGIIETFRQFKERYDTDHALVLVGAAGYGWETAATLIARSRLEQDIILPGYVSDEELPQWYAAADVFFFPSQYEGFGLPVLEAMAAGTPVVTSTAGSLPEVAGTAALAAAPGDPAALAEHLYAAASDTAVRARLIAAGRERVRGYEWEQCAQATWETLTVSCPQR